MVFCACSIRQQNSIVHEGDTLIELILERKVAGLQEITVSILCATYNHEKYIRQALEGFVSQKTNFLFEVIVHDDASTDKTRDILCEYQALYPELIHPVFQSENQWSKGKGITLNFLVPKACGKYIALCEGDDFWTDPLKLQKQVDYIEAHPDCALVAHDAIQVWENGSLKAKLYSAVAHGSDRILLIDELVGNLGAFPTASMLFRRSFYNDHYYFLKSIKNFDYVIKILLASTGYVYLMPDVMSAYRKGAADSWSVKMLYDNTKAIEHIQTSIDNIKRIDEYTEKKHTQSLSREIRNREIKILIKQGNKSVLLRKHFYVHLCSMRLRSIFIIIMQVLFPKTLVCIQKARWSSNSSIGIE